MSNSYFAVNEGVTSIVVGKNIPRSLKLLFPALKINWSSLSPPIYHICTLDDNLVSMVEVVEKLGRGFNDVVYVLIGVPSVF